LTAEDGNLLSSQQLAALKSSLHQGSANASAALKRWIGKDSVVEINSLRQLPLQQATTVLPASDQPICFCCLELTGLLSGKMIMAFADPCGWALADLLLDQPPGTTSQWTEMATSAALETTNILCCAYLNSLADSFSTATSAPGLVPQPPTFHREFAESLLQFALMGQAIEFDQVIVAQTRFEIERSAVQWTLLFVPDADSMSRLPELLDRLEARP
jgi:chemotaxis protein CheC